MINITEFENELLEMMEKSREDYGNNLFNDPNFILDALKTWYEVGEDIDQLNHIYELIPESMWDSWSFTEKIIEMKDEDMINNGYDALIYENIPDSFWKNKNNALRAIHLIMSFERYNNYEIFPSSLWEDKDIALEMVNLDWSSMMEVPMKYKLEEEFVLAALDNAEARMQDSWNSDDYHVRPMEPEEVLEDIFSEEYEYIPKSLNSNKELIIKILERYDSFFYGHKVIFNWIDKSLWSNKEFVLKVLNINEEAIDFVDDKLKSDPDIQQYL